MADSSSSNFSNTNQRAENSKTKRCSRPLIMKVHPRNYDRKVTSINTNLLETCKSQYPSCLLLEGQLLCSICDLRIRKFLTEGTLLNHLKTQYGGDRVIEPPTPVEVSDSNPTTPRKKRKFLRMSPRRKLARDANQESKAVSKVATICSQPSSRSQTGSATQSVRSTHTSSQSGSADTRPSSGSHGPNGTTTAFPGPTQASCVRGTRKNGGIIFRRRQRRPPSYQDDDPESSTSKSSTSSRSQPLTVSPKAPNEDRESSGGSSNTVYNTSGAESSTESQLDSCAVGSDCSEEEELQQLNSALKLLKSPKVTMKVKRNPSRFRQVFQSASKNLLDRFSRLDENSGAHLESSAKNSCPNCRWLLEGCKGKFAEATDKKDKYRILTLFHGFGRTRLQKEFQCTEHMAKCAAKQRNLFGPYSFPTYLSTGHPIRPGDINTIINFYLDDGNSTISPRMDDTMLVLNTRTGKKERVSKRRMLCNLRELYEAFTADDHCRHTSRIKIGISKFAMLRPKQCQWPGLEGFKNTCLCALHENLKFVMHYLGEDVNKVGEFLARFLCNNPGPDCHLGFCELCPNYDILNTRYELDGVSTTFTQWDTTERAVLRDVTYEAGDFKDFFKILLERSCAHHFVMKSQKAYFDNVKSQLFDEGAILIIVDFAENYRYLIKDAVQGVHWSNDAATIHPFVVYFAEEEISEAPENPGEKKVVVKYKTFVALSDSGEHDAFSFHAFLTRMWDAYGDEAIFSKAQKVYYASDGAGSQYKNKYNFFNLMNHRKDFQKPAEWIFFATAHGKSPCDGISGVTKRKIRLISLSGTRITNSLEMLNNCMNALATERLSFFHVSGQEIEEHKKKLQERVSLAQTVKGTRKFHSFEPVVNILRCKFTSASERYVDHSFGSIPEYEEYVVGEFVAFKIHSGYAIGEVISLEVDDDETELELKIMHPRENENLFVLNINRSLKKIWDVDVILRIRSPKHVRENLYTLNQAQFDQLKLMFD